MISTFNHTKLLALLKDFYTLTNIRITVFDDSFRELVCYPQELSPFCRLIRTDKLGYEECMKCDREACRTASTMRTPYTYQCHAGLKESIAPLYMGNIVVGYLFFGQIFSYESPDHGWREVNRCCRHYKIDLGKLKEICLELPVISEEYIISASHILEAVASFLCMERMAFLKQKDLPIQIDEYINAHFTEPIDVPDICATFQIGKTYLYEIAKQSYGMGIAEHIRALRIQRAKELLTKQNRISIAQIASECGFTDYNYFITVFKRLTGMPPRRYREIMQQDYF